VVAAGPFVLIVTRALEIGRMRSADFPPREQEMDFNSLMGYVQSLGLLYAWTLFAAGAFALGERFCRGIFAQRQPAPDEAKDPAKG
jgi:hypothetical protein